MIKKELKSIGYALRGIKEFLIIEDHGKIHLLATIFVLPIIIFFTTNYVEKTLLIIVISLVWVTEIANSAIEKTLDFITTTHNTQIKYIKDVMAGAVLITSLTSVIVAIIIILPKINFYVFK